MMIPHLKVNSSIRFNKKLLLKVTKTISINKAVQENNVHNIPESKARKTCSRSNTFL